MNIKDIRNLFDIGVTIQLGDEEILIIGRNYYGEEDYSYIEHTYTFPDTAEISEIYKEIKESFKNE